jgi:hypothetical protein
LVHRMTTLSGQINPQPLRLYQMVDSKEKCPCLWRNTNRPHSTWGCSR